MNIISIRKVGIFFGYSHKKLIVLEGVLKCLNKYYTETDKVSYKDVCDFDSTTPSFKVVTSNSNFIIYTKNEEIYGYGGFDYDRLFRGRKFDDIILCNYFLNDTGIRYVDLLCSLKDVNKESIRFIDFDSIDGKDSEKIII